MFDGIAWPLCSGSIKHNSSSVFLIKRLLVDAIVRPNDFHNALNQIVRAVRLSKHRRHACRNFGQYFLRLNYHRNSQQFLEGEWRDRIILDRMTGMRPWEIRNLQKDRVDFKRWIINLRAEDTKTRAARSFSVQSDLLREILTRRRDEFPGSPFFFCNERDHSKPMDKHLNGWNSTLSRAGLIAEYTPHDLRHTYLTEAFRRSKDWAAICYQAGLTLEEEEEIRRIVLRTGTIIEDYPTDARGHSCLVFGVGKGKRTIHVVCSPQEDYLAIITAYLPDPKQWSRDFTQRRAR